MLISLLLFRIRYRVRLQFVQGGGDATAFSIARGFTTRIERIKVRAPPWWRRKTSMKSLTAFGARALVVLLMAGSLAACSARTTQVVVEGAPERVDAYLVRQTAAHPRLRASLSSPDSKGQVAATLILPRGASSADTMQLMTQAMEAKLNVSYSATTARSWIRLG
jgi:hypothetical protein